MKERRRRRPNVLPTVGLIVEGDAEFAALPLLQRKALLPGCPPLRPINLGGVGSTIEPIGIARMVKPKVVQHQTAGRSPIVVCIDREQRDMSAIRLGTEVHRALCTLLRKEKRAYHDVFVVIADRTFEAWILADARGLHQKRAFVRAPSFETFEGSMGKEQKKGLVELTELLGRPYGKRTDGPRLFEKLRFVEARKHGAGEHGSRSLDSFLTTLGV